MFIALYRWRLKEGREERFREGWRRLTAEIYGRRGSRGSRLHRAEDGTWVAYAQWPDRRTWESASGAEAADVEAARMMRESIESSHPAVLMEVSDDLLESGGPESPSG
jgi:heme-degrading monooxygenase HmoA